MRLAQPLTGAAWAIAILFTACDRSPPSTAKADAAAEAKADVQAIASSEHSDEATQSTPTAETAAETWKTDVQAIASSGDNEARRETIRRQLLALGLQARDQPFSRDRQEGVNLLANVSGEPEAPLLLLGAHTDRVDEGQGATDNASGVAVVLALAKRFQRQPLRVHRVAIALWDLEEKGLQGSRAYVAGGNERPALYVNFDVFGWGDTLWMMTPEPDHPLVTATTTTTETAAFGFFAGDQYPPTDHLAFLHAGWPAVSYSLAGGDEIPLIVSMYEGNEPDPVPKVMRIIHSPADTIEHLDPAAVAHGIDMVERSLRRWDALLATAHPQ